MLDIGIHALDRALYLMDFPNPVTVSGVTFSKLGTQGVGLGGWGSDIHQPTDASQFDVDDLAWALVRFDNGAALQLQVSWAVNNKDQFFTEIYGTKGGAHVGDQDQLELHTSLNNQQADVEIKVPRSGAGTYTHLVNNFVRYLDGDTTAEIIAPQEALTSVKIIEGVLRSATEGREVSIADL